ncbi:S8 family serine peptidase [Oceanibaculum indicum]|uniref:Proprotein convertase P-domain-containing protein n=1 Tax=Oceanibaculum indicum TaxID=526216 RepID=A0A420WRP7_9PROT|nr:S8 family serine peptidase [Oceanibaculum indicum]RKQ73502.1 proprotein convertase P-domain-containing protein [Oceanibaculum indicum]
MLPTDTYFPYQWHLINTGQDGARVGVDLNVVPVWQDYTGKGVIVGIYDSGVQVGHPDLSANFDPALQPTTVFGPHDPDPVDGRFVTQDGHGTAVAGLILAANNGFGVVGVAYDATFGAVNLILSDSYESDNEAGDATELTALNYQMALYDVINHSYGPDTPFISNFTEFENFANLASMDRAALLGRDGLGTVHVVAGGNERTDGNMTTYGDLGNLRYTINVAAGSAEGDILYYSNPGASLVVTAPVDRNPGDDGFKSVTTDLLAGLGYSGSNNAEIDSPDYSDQMNGTSAAAPMVTGVVALMLEANPLLGYRDVQEILALTARANWQEGAYELYDWQTNGATYWNGGGLEFSHDYGFGFVDALAAVRLAESWTDQRTRYNEQIEVVEALDIDTAIPNTGVPLSYSFEVEADFTVEWVELAVGLDHSWWGDLTVTLLSPDGTESVLMNRPGVTPDTNAGLDIPVSASGFEGEDELQFIFASNAPRGELADGAWTVTVTDAGAAGFGVLEDLTLLLYGRPEEDVQTFYYTDRYADLAAEQAGRQSLQTDGPAKINAAAVSGDVVIDLSPGMLGSIAGADFTLVAGSIVTEILAGGGNDSLTASDIGTILAGAHGHDALTGGAGADLLEGNKNADTLVGGLGDDTLRGGKGHDRLDGGGGNDVMHGGLGENIFAFADGSGIDTIMDFGIGRDRIEVSQGINGTNISTAADLLALVASDIAGNAVLDLGSGNHVTLVGVAAAALAEDHFLISAPIA